MLPYPFSLPGFEIRQITVGASKLIITASATSTNALCPTCHQISQRIHSLYTRSPHDLPMSGQAVQLTLHVRRFRCQNQRCQRKTFVERIPDVVLLHARAYHTTHCNTCLVCRCSQRTSRFTSSHAGRNGPEFSNPFTSGKTHGGSISRDTQSSRRR